MFFGSELMRNEVIVPAIGGLAAGIVLIILFASFDSQLFSKQENIYRGMYMVEADGKIDITPARVEQGCSNCITLQVWDAETYVRETGKSTVKAEFLVQNVTVQRGGYADVPLRLVHVGGSNYEPYVEVRVLPPVGYTLYPKSVAESSTEEERFEAAKAGTMLRGGIDIAQFVLPTDPVIIKVGSQEIINVRFVVPANIVKEVDGTFVPILLEVTMQSSSSQDSIFNGSTGIELIIPA
jgi:hypothetical protein